MKPKNIALLVILVVSLAAVVSIASNRQSALTNTQAQSSPSYKNMVLVTVAYYSASGVGFNDARVSQATYCGDPLSPVGTRIQEPTRKQATIEMWYRMSPKSGDCEVKVLFTKDPGHRITSATIFNNVNETSPFESTTSKTASTAIASPGKIEISVSGAKDTVLMCSYATYPNGGSNKITSAVARNEFWKHDGRIDGFYRNIASGLGVSFTRRSAGETLTHTWNTTQTMPWAVLCANVRSKPFSTPVQTPPPTPRPPTPPPTPMPKPTVNIKVNGSDGPLTLNSGASATISWTSTNATGCVASNGWSGNKSTNGSESTGVLIGSKIYTITCSNTSGSATDSVTVNVTSATTQINHYVDIKMAPAGLSNYVDFGPFDAKRGDTYTIRWRAASDITRCEAVGAGDSVTPKWTGEKPLSGTVTVTNNLGYGRVGLICYGKWGATGDAAAFGNYNTDVDIKASIVSGSVDQNTYSDGPITLRASTGSILNLKWQTLPSYTSCTASGSWTGTKATKGTQRLVFSTAGQRQYILTCKTATGATRQDHIAVNVESANSVLPAEIVKAGSGYLGNYYKNKAFETLKFQKVDGTLSFDWGSASSPNVSVLGTDAFSIRWGGQLVPWKTGQHRFVATSDEGVRVYLDDKLIINNWTAHASTVNTATVNLVAGRPYKLKIEYFEGTGKAIFVWGMNYGTENTPALIDVRQLAPQ